MWEILRTRPRGRVSLRNLPLLATTIIAAVLVHTGMAATPVLAAGDVQRTSDGFFSYQNNVFNNPKTLTAGDPLLAVLAPTSPGLVVYQYQTAGSDTLELLLFAPGVDAKTATTTLYTTVKFTAPSTYSNQSPSPPTQLTISSDPAVLSAQNTGKNSCSVPGIGWIVCPVTNFIAGLVDGIYGFIMMFLDVKPLLAGSPIYDVWNTIRGIANIGFVIMFLIVIFSQVTSLGISAYGLRKALPRLVIAAILVNVSYYICAIGIDISNFLGHSVYALLRSYADALNSAGSANITWSSLAQGILAGTLGAGGAAAGYVWFSAATAGGPGAILFTLLGMLITVALAALTALIILIARQALLILFILISPLAFVGMVLPSTEKWYKKWHEAFSALLFMFPIFSFVFGGAMLAGAAIIVGAGGNIFIIIMGKAVQILPLFVTPLIMRFSTGILGAIAKMTNDRNKGLIDRARNWTNGQAEHYRKKSVANPNNRRYNPFRWTAQRFDDISRRQKLEEQGYEDASEARAKSGGGNRRRLHKYRDAYNYAQSSRASNDTEDNLLKGNYDRLRRTDGDTVVREIRRRESEVYAKLQAEKLDKMHAEVVAEGAANQHLQGLNIQNANLRAQLLAGANAIKLDTEEIAFTGIAKKMAERTHQNNISSILEQNTRQVDGMNVRTYSGGIQGGQGENAALAYAVSLQRKQFGESIAEANELIKHYAPDTGDLQNMIVGEDSQGNPVTTARGVRRDRHGNVISTFEFSRNDIFTMEAAIENNITIGTVPMVDKILELSGGELSEYRTSIANALAKAGHSGRSIYEGGRLINEVSQGRITSANDLTSYVQKQILDGKFSAAQLSNLDAPAVERFLEAASRAPIDPSIDPVAFARSVRRLAGKVNVALTSSQTQENIKENAIPAFRRIHALDPTLPPLPPDF